VVQLRAETQWADPTRVNNLALNANAFTLRHRAHSLAPPTKLAGVREHQEALLGLHQSEPEPWLELAMVPAEGRVDVHAGAFKLGHIWPGYTWLWPLLTVGVECRLIAVTGTDADWKWLGCNVVLTHLAGAVQKATTKPQVRLPDAPHPDYRIGPSVNGKTA
jgi:hypothetical protein